MVVYEKVLADIENFDPMDVLNSDDIVVDAYGDPKGRFIVTVQFIEEPDIE